MGYTWDTYMGYTHGIRTWDTHMRYTHGIHNLRWRTWPKLEIQKVRFAYDVHHIGKRCFKNPSLKNQFCPIQVDPTLHAQIFA